MGFIYMLLPLQPEHLPDKCSETEIVGNIQKYIPILYRSGLHPGLDHFLLSYFEVFKLSHKDRIKFSPYCMLINTLTLLGL